MSAFRVSPQIVIVGLAMLAAGFGLGIVAHDKYTEGTGDRMRKECTSIAEASGLIRAVASDYDVLQRVPKEHPELKPKIDSIGGDTFTPQIAYLKEHEPLAWNEAFAIVAVENAEETRRSLITQCIMRRGMRLG